jgi:hypothetical protein
MRSDGDARSSADIERDIEYTRRDIDETLGELSARLSPGQLLDRAIVYLRNSGPPEFASNLGRSVRDNPLPVVLTGISLAWLAWSSKRPTFRDTAEAWRDESGLGEKLGERVSSAAGQARDMWYAAKDRGRELAEQASDSAEAARRAGERIGAGARRARDRAGRALEDDPWVVGLAAFAAGALIAGLMPPTRAEDEMLGEVRDRTLESAADQARDALRSGREAARGDIP